MAVVTENLLSHCAKGKAMQQGYNDPRSRERTYSAFKKLRHPFCLSEENFEGAGGSELIFQMILKLRRLGRDRFLEYRFCVGCLRCQPASDLVPSGICGFFENNGSTGFRF